MSKEIVHLLNTPISQGTYYIDNEAVSAEELCFRGEALDPSIRHSGWPGMVVIGQLVNGGTPDAQRELHIIPHPNPNPTDSYVSTHEAAEVLRRHGHVVSNQPT
jgi:hypothetical protein